MKHPVRIGTLAFVCASVWQLASAQDLATTLESTPAGGDSSQPATATSAADLGHLGSARIAPAGMPSQSAPLVIPVQNPATLGTADEFGSVPRATATNAGESLAGWIQRTWPGQMTVAMALLAAGGEKSHAAAVPAADTLDQGSECFSLALRVGQRIKEDPSSLLETAAAEVAANPSCACEVVKAALTAVKADAETTARVVEVTTVAAPETLRMVAQCAIAVQPEALSKVQAILARLDPNGGKALTKLADAKDAKVGLEKAVLEPAANPLDLLWIVPPPPPPPITNPDGLYFCLPSRRK